MRENQRGTPDKRFATNIRERLAANMRQLRERSGMSQSALAAAMNERGVPWHQQTVGRIEAGRQQLLAAEAVELTAVLKTSLDRLTWPAAEASATEFVYAAGAEVRQSYEKIADAVMRGLVAASRAERALAGSEGDPSPRVQEARDGTAACLKEFSVSEAIAEGARRYDELTGADEDEAAEG